MNICIIVLKQRKLDEKTVRAYRIDLRQFSEFCVQKKLVTEKAVIRQYILHLHESYKQKTVKRKVASIKAFYSYLEDEEIIDDSPLRKIRTEFREEKNFTTLDSVFCLAVIIK